MAGVLQRLQGRKQFGGLRSRSPDGVGHVYIYNKKANNSSPAILSCYVINSLDHFWLVWAADWARIVGDGLLSLSVTVTVLPGYRYCYWKDELHPSIFVRLSYRYDHCTVTCTYRDSILP